MVAVRVCEVGVCHAVGDTGFTGVSSCFPGISSPDEVHDSPVEEACLGAVVGADSPTTEITIDSVETKVVASVRCENLDPFAPVITIPEEDGCIPPGMSFEAVVTISDVTGVDAPGTNRS